MKVFQNPIFFLKPILLYFFIIFIINLSFESCAVGFPNNIFHLPTSVENWEIDIINKNDTCNNKLVKVLFVGNSLTYYNNLPELFEKLAEHNNVQVKTKMIVSANLSLEDHWNRGEVHNELNNETYHYIILQQGPSSQIEGRKVLLEYAMKFKELCNEKSTKMAFFMVWPAIYNFHTFNGVILNYTDAAIMTNSILCPVGKEWKDYIESTNDFSYYGKDQFHPSLKGSQEAAKIIFNSLNVLSQD